MHYNSPTFLPAVDEAGAKTKPKLWSYRSETPKSEPQTSVPAETQKQLRKKRMTAGIKYVKYPD